MDEQCCGNCEWWSLDAGGEYCDVKVKVPFWIVRQIGNGWWYEDSEMRRTLCGDGSGCTSWGPA